MSYQLMQALQHQAFGVYVIGANDLYKTTWCLDLKKYYGLPLITEVPGIVLERHNTNFPTVRADADKATEIQREIFTEQRDTELRQDGPYFSDGAWNNLAFMCEYGLDAGELVESKEFDEYLKVFRRGICFFVRPHPDIISRPEFVSKSGTKRDAVVGIDKLLKGIIEMKKLRCLHVWSWSAQERRRIAEFVLGTPEEFHAAVAANRASAEATPSGENGYTHP